MGLGWQNSVSKLGSETVLLFSSQAGRAHGQHDLHDTRRARPASILSFWLVTKTEINKGENMTNFLLKGSSKNSLTLLKFHTILYFMRRWFVSLILGRISCDNRDTRVNRGVCGKCNNPFNASLSFHGYKVVDISHTFHNFPLTCIFNKRLVEFVFGDLRRPSLNHYRHPEHFFCVQHFLHEKVFNCANTWSVNLFLHKDKAPARKLIKMAFLWVCSVPKLLLSGAVHPK